MHFRLQTPDHLGCHISSSEKKAKLENQDCLSLASEYGMFQQGQQMSVKQKKERQQFDVLL